MQMYLCLSNFFRRLDMSIFETDGQTTRWIDRGTVRIPKHVRVRVDAVKLMRK